MRTLRSLLFAGPWLWFALQEALRAGSPRAYLWVVWAWVFWSRLAQLLGPRLRAALALTAAALLLVEIGVQKHYGAWLDARMLHATVEAWNDLKASLLPMVPWFAVGTLLVASIFHLLLRRMPPPRAALRHGAWIAVATGIAAQFGGAAPPDARLIHALAHFRGHGAQVLAGAASLPDVPVHQTKLPHVLLIITESVRASDACVVPGAPCETQREIEREMPERVGFARGYSLASYTLVSVATLLEGHVPTGSVRPPQLFDYLTHLQGVPVDVAYFGTHAAEVLSRPRDATTIADFASLESFHKGNIDDEDLLLSEANDAKLIPKVRDHARAHRGHPSFTVVHFSGTHAPYYVNESFTPFTPWTHRASWATLAPLHNAYKNAIAMQDRTTAQLLHEFKSAHDGEPWIILYTSDHGEAFGEHNGIHHGQNAYDEQTHVPFWLAHSPGALSATQAANVRNYASRTVTHADVTPTVLDLFGVLDALPWAPQRAKFQGRSLVREVQPLGLLPLTSCTPLFTCPLANWGVMAEDRKLLAQPWDSDWRCVSVPSNDELPSSACTPLLAQSRVWYPQLPNGKPNEPSPAR